MSLLQTNSAGVANATTVNLNGLTTTSGSLIVASCAGYSSGTLQNYVLTDNKSNSYSENGAGPLNVSSNVRCHQRYCPNITGGGSHNFTQTAAAAAYQTLIIEEWSGMDTSTPLDKTAAATGTSTSPSSGATATRSQADEVLIGTVATDDNVSQTPTAGAGFTIASGGSNGSNNNEVSALEYQIVAATGTTAATFSLSTSAAWGCIIGTYKIAGAVTGRIWKLAGIGGGLAGGSHGLAG